MELSHHQALLAGYSTAMIGWVSVRRFCPALWPAHGQVGFARPWMEFGLAIVAVFALLGLGQLLQHGFLFSTKGDYGPALFVANQMILFSPMILLLVLRRHPMSSAWLPTGRIWLRIAVGLTLALLALLGFSLVRSSTGGWLCLVASVFQPSHAGLAVHIFLEDLSIAILFVRLGAACQRPYLVAVVVSALFAAAHVPGELAAGAALVELSPLLLDFGLGVLVLMVLCRSADIWWFWCVHFAMDMTQFAGT